ncbi:ATP-binding cassette domain-containing protein [Acidianus brierleyi]|uniref:ABC transporter n=1 Tax=Acidianus brierleyi TaxID=41673 RepID=A0A2U9IB61_9CREN|nr:ATP-binding cassette domain-containing protein [Acidianus brierleyi]AWR93249.1 ATP-binding cassette domain-containing protein [Acidianus brierleyi]
MIELNNVSIFYGKDKVVKDVNATINEKVILLGPNGSGKSTLLKAIAGIIPYQGHIFIDGKEVSKLRNYTELSTNINEAFSLGVKLKDVIYIYEEIKGINSKLAIGMLSQLGLKDLNKNIYSLSAGQGVIFRTIIALASNSKIILLDEPFENVDIGKRKIIANWIKEYGKEGIIVTHELDMVKIFKDYKANLIFEGKVFGPITAKDILESSIIEGEDQSAILEIEVNKKKYSFVKGEKGYKVENLVTLDRIYNLGE